MTILGQILRRSERRETAIYLRDGVLWVADFVDGQGHLVDAESWLRFNFATPRPILEEALGRLEDAFRDLRTGR